MTRSSARSPNLTPSCGNPHRQSPKNIQEGRTRHDFRKARSLHTLMSFAAALVLFLPITGFFAQTQDFQDPSASSVTKRMLPRSGSADRSVGMNNDVAGRKPGASLRCWPQSPPAAILPETASLCRSPRLPGSRRPAEYRNGRPQRRWHRRPHSERWEYQQHQPASRNRNGTFQPLKLINAGGNFPSTLQSPTLMAMARMTSL